MCNALGFFNFREEDPEDSVPHGHITSLVRTSLVEHEKSETPSKLKADGGQGRS